MRASGSTTPLSVFKSLIRNSRCTGSMVSAGVSMAGFMNRPSVTPASMVLRWIGNSSALTPPHDTPCPRASQLAPCANHHPTIVLDSDTTLTQFRNGLINLTSRNWPTSIRRHWQSTTLTAPCQRLHHTHPRSAAWATYAATVLSLWLLVNDPIHRSRRVSF